MTTITVVPITTTLLRYHTGQLWEGNVFSLSDWRSAIGDYCPSLAAK